MFRWLSGGAVAVTIFLSAIISEASSFVVTNTLPSGPGSLFDAIYGCATNTTVANQITFAIPGSPPFIIAPTQLFNVLYGNVTIDGTTQPGFVSNTPVVVIDGSLAGSNQVGCITAYGSSNLIRGLRIQNYSWTGIRLDNLSDGSQFNRIEGCHIISNGYYGINVYPSSNTVIGGFAASNRNVVAGNAAGEIAIEFSSDNVIAGNWIGVNPTNSAQKMGGPGSGLWLFKCWSNLVSGTGVASQVISGNGYAGVRLDQGGGHTLVGNYIGCDASGTVLVSNKYFGVLVQDGVSNQIGGAIALRNYITASGQAGVELSGYSHGNAVQANFIGVASTGISALPNLRGVVLENGSSNNLVGGSSGGLANLIGGNTFEGVLIYGVGNHIEGNVIGLGSNFSTPVGNGANGVFVSGAYNVVGGTNGAAGNVISANGANGIYLSGGPSSAVQGNVIGLDAFGNRRPNLDSGIKLDYTTGNLIGGTSSSARNIISGNAFVGIRVEQQASGDVIQGNYIGVGLDGLTRASNTVDGVRQYGGTNITIGGSVPGAGNIIAGNGQYNIQLLEASVNTKIQGNYVGVGADLRTNYWSTNALGRAGMVIAGGGTIIGGTDANARNVVSGNAGYGIYVYRATNTVIAGNLVGLGGTTGTNVIPNGPNSSSYGVFVDVGSTRTTIGGVTPAERNVIAGDYAAINMRDTSANFVWGNYIGITAAGNIAVTQTQVGVGIDSGFANEIGGTNAGAGNVIYGKQVGVALTTTNTHHNFVQGNIVNLGPTGNIITTNVLTGISMVAAQSNRIGGAAAGARNIVFCGPGGTGVEFWLGNTLGNIVQGNYVGVGPDGVSPRKFSPNAGTGVHAFYAGNNTIGGTNAGEGNIIAHCAYGVLVFNNSAVQNAIFGNTIYSNVWNGSPNVGIDLAPAGGADKTTPNDNVPDSDTGPNNLQNFPVITNAVSLPGSTRVRGYLASASNTKYRIEFFYSDTTNAEGRVYLGATNITTAANGTNAFTAVLNGYAPTSKYITATATDPNNNTSEFCPGVIKPTTAADADNDGIPDFWEGAYGLNFNDPSDATNHLDADGINNRDEYFSGTIPNNSASYLHVAEISIGDINWISFPSSQFRNYNLEAAAAATNNAVWTPILTNILGSGLTITVGDSVDATNQFYRVRSIFP